MKLKELEVQAMEELAQEQIEKHKAIIKGRIREVRAAKRTLAKLEQQYQDLLDQDIEEEVEDEF